MSLVLTTAPAIQPVKLEDVKSYLRIDGTSEDTLLKAMMKAATTRCEQHVEKSFINTVWTLWFDRFPSDRRQEPWWDGTREGAVDHFLVPKDEIELRRGPLVSVAHIKTYNDSNTASTFDTSNYQVDTKHPNGRVFLNSGSTWPSDLRDFNAVEIQYTAGYGSSRNDVPEDIKQAIMLLICHLYENRGCDDSKLPATITTMLAPYKTMVF